LTPSDRGFLFGIKMDQPATTANLSGNGETSLRDLFALTDEQILEIEPEAQDVQVRGSTDAGEVSPAARADSSSQATSSASQNDDASATAHTSQNAPNKASHESPVTSRVPSAPPKWLADRMADPQTGAEARNLWDGIQQERQEAAAYREIFAKPQEAKSAAERARLLDDIDRAYFAGDATQRAHLATTMLREDPAAFREMVFAGLRALEESEKGTSSTADATNIPRLAKALGADRSNAPAGVQQAAPHLGNAPAAEAQIAAYAAFERSANEELERSVGGAIERTLDQALPNGGRADSAAMKTRLAATIRQDIEKALQGDQQLGQQVAQILSARGSGTQTFRFDNEARAQVVRLIGERAQQLVPAAAKRVLSDWTQTTLASHHARTSRAEASSARREVATASSGSRTGSPPASPPRPQQSQTRRQDPDLLLQPGSRRSIDYRRLSDEQILDL
jgi:hypothetical protein